MQGNRKGITPVVSVILLLLITISIVGFSLIFFQRTAQGAGEEAQTQLQQQLASASESFEIVNIDKNKVYVKNTGTAALSNLRFYVDGSEISATSIPIAPNTVGEAALDSAKLAQVPGDKLKVTSLGSQDSVDAKFYAKQTVAYWRFDESDGRTAKDYSGNGNDGTFVGETWNDGTLTDANPANADGNKPPQPTAGKYGSALTFDGVDDYIPTTKALDNAIPAGSSVTLMAWINLDGYANPPSATPGRLIVGETGVDFQTRYAIYIDSDGKLKYGWANGGYISGDRILPLNEWHFVAAVHTGNNVKLFIDGVLDKNFDGATPIATINLANQQPVAVGMWLDWWEQQNTVFNGTIDEVRIYNRALTQQEILDDMNSPYPVSRPLASYSFEKVENSKTLDTHNIVKGRYGAALSFDGVDDYVDLPNSVSLNCSGINPFTITGWVKTDVSQGTNIGIYAKSFIGGYSYQRFCNLEFSSATFQGVIGNQTAGESKTITATGTYTDNQWHLGTVVFNSTHLLIYVDGVSRATPVAMTIVGIEPVSTAVNRIGSGTSHGGFFNGIIDEVRILNVAR